MGLGQTGFSCVQFLHGAGHFVSVVDTRSEPPLKAQLETRYPDVPLFCNTLPEIAHLTPFSLILSPGISPEHSLIQPLVSMAEQRLSDISLFMQCHSLPVVAITGSNGKSTVTTLVGEMAKASGLLPAVVGNIGVPVLSLIDATTGKLMQPYDLIVMELSSFQLDITDHLQTKAAVVLNISPDHLDRYKNIHDYAASKRTIYKNTENAIINRDDDLSWATEWGSCKKTYFSKTLTKENQFGLTTDNANTYLCYGSQRLLNTAKMKLMGEHNYLNALAALALGYAIGLPLRNMLTTLSNFCGLAHRCEWVTEYAGIQWVNDSKGTNISASVAALLGLGAQLDIGGKIVLLLGGQGKGQNFNEMLEPVLKYCRAVITMGENSNELFAQFNSHLRTVQAQDMESAIELSFECARKGDIILLSPACASLDQYRNFEHRGECFKEAVFKIFSSKNVV